MKFQFSLQDKLVIVFVSLAVVYLCWASYDYKTSENIRVSEIVDTKRAVDELTSILFNSTYPGIKQIGASLQKENVILIIFRAGADQNSVKALFPNNKYKQWDLEYKEE